MELKKLVLLCPHKLHMKPIQRCKVHQIFVSYVFYCNVKEKDHIRRNINSKKKEMFICEISIIFICQKLRSLGSLKQEVKLPSPYGRG